MGEITFDLVEISYTNCYKEEKKEEKKDALNGTRRTSQR